MTADTATIRIDAPAGEVFEFMADPGRLDLWSFGTWRTEIAANGLIRGRSLQTGAPIWLRITPHALLMLIDYHLGEEPDALSPRIYARVIPGPVTGHDPNTCALVLTALRGAAMDDDRWARLIRAHAFELDVIKALIETGHDHRHP